MRNRYQEELAELLNKVRLMGTQLEDTLEKTLANLVQKDYKLAQAIIDGDAVFDDEEREIEKSCLKLLLTQTPVASDLREITGCLKLVGDLERIADHCSDISQYTQKLALKRELGVYEAFQPMIQTTWEMVCDSITAISELDAELAAKVIARDDVVDELFQELKRMLTEKMRADSRDVVASVEWLMICKYLERVADHATNIAEWVIYTVENKLK